VKLEADSLSKLNVGQRLKLLEDKIISYTKELIALRSFRDSAAGSPVRISWRWRSSAGFPNDALNVDLFAMAEGNGISGYVARRAILHLSGCRARSEIMCSASIRPGAA